MNTDSSIDYGGRTIDVATAPLASGGYGIVRIEVWTRAGRTDHVDLLPLSRPLTFTSESAARNAAVWIAIEAIDAGTV